MRSESVEERDNRLKMLREKQNEERQKKLEELKAQALDAQRFREKKEEERRKRIEELRTRDNDRRQQVSIFICKITIKFNDPCRVLFILLRAKFRCLCISHNLGNILFLLNFVVILSNTLDYFFYVCVCVCV